MNMSEWAENEIKLACKNENCNWDGKSFDYGCSCYQSALKAYKSLLKDEHSGFSWSLTSEILLRLIKGLPLMPITDSDFFDGKSEVDESDSYLKENDLKSSIQCSRMSSLFRNEKNDGTVTYNDVSRSYCYNTKDASDSFEWGGANRIINKLFPIKMPYLPPVQKFIVECDCDGDEIKVLSIKCPDGKILNGKELENERN